MPSSPYVSMTPADAAVAFRSFSRRFHEASRSAVLTLDDEPDPAEINEVANRPGSDGRSAVDLVAATAHLFDQLDRALGSALVSTTATIDHKLIEPEPTATVEHSGDLDHEVGRLRRAAVAVADRIDGADPERWLVSSPTTMGATATPLDLVRSAVTVAVTRINEVDRVLREVRGRR